MRDRAARDGLCSRCGKGEPVVGRRQCQRCADLGAMYAKAWRSGTLEEYVDDRAVYVTAQPPNPRPLARLPDRPASPSRPTKAKVYLDSLEPTTEYDEGPFHDDE